MMMVPETPNPLDALLPDKHPQHDFFVCDVADAVLKDLMPQMEHPFYALSKKPDMGIRRYEHGERWLEIHPSTKGQATIYDKDILIFAVSQAIAKLKTGQKIDRKMRFSPYEFLVFANRGTGGKDYDAFEDALFRLSGTLIRTNITTIDDEMPAEDDRYVPAGDEEINGYFHLIHEAKVVRKPGQKRGRILWAEVVLSEWVFNSIRRKAVLTLHRSYFFIDKPIDRRIYEIARKLCGTQPSLEIGLEKLMRRTGVRITPKGDDGTVTDAQLKASLKKFRWRICELVKRNSLPDYEVSFDVERDIVTFWSRPDFVDAVAEFEPKSAGDLYELSPQCLETARMRAPGWCIVELQRQFRVWVGQQSVKPRNPEAMFITFCTTKGPYRPDGQSSFL